MKTLIDVLAALSDFVKIASEWAESASKAEVETFTQICPQKDVRQSVLIPNPGVNALCSPLPSQYILLRQTDGNPRDVVHIHVPSGCRVSVVTDAFSRW